MRFAVVTDQFKMHGPFGTRRKARNWAVEMFGNMTSQNHIRWRVISLPVAP